MMSVFDRMKALLVVGCLVSPTISPATVRAARSLDEIREEYLAVVHQFPCSKEEDYFPLLTEPHGVAALDETWPLLMEWARRYLDEHPEATSAEIGQELQPSPRDFCATALQWWNPHFRLERLGPKGDIAFAVTVNYATVGTFFILAPGDDGHLRMAWSLPDPGPASSYDHNTDWGLGPQSRMLRLLPPTTNGEARFYVLSMGFAPAGCCGGQHLSLWQWNGKNLRNVLWKDYPICRCEDGVYSGQNIQLVEGVLQVAMKGELKTIGTSCGDANPKATWRARIGADEVEDLGEQWEDPDLHFADDLVSRVLHKQDTSQLIAPEATAELYAALAPEAHYLPKSSFLGTGWVHTAEAGGAKVSTILFDSGPVNHVSLFVVERDGHPYVKSVDVR